MFGADPAINGRLEEIQAHSAEIREQLGHILASPLFRNSRHYPALLRYVVEQTLEGRGPHLKERTLGVEVFGRPADYDTNLDPVVRTSACEVRKRIALYYHDATHEHELRIDIPSGSYLPEFHFSEPASAPPLPVTTVPDTAPAPRRFTALQQVRAHRVFAGVVLAVIAIGAATASLRGSRRALDQFWGPVWTGPERVMICMGGRSGVEVAKTALARPNALPSAFQVSRGDRVAFADAVTMGRLFSVMRDHGKGYDVGRASSVTLADLRRGPVVLVGAFNNVWTMSLTKHLRYTFEFEAGREGPMRIFDAKNPGDTRWRIDQQLAYNRVTKDYAIVSRVVDPLTERIVITVGGLMKEGTVAAGEFVSEERYLAALASKAPRGWERKNLQVVLGTELVDGVPGPPRVLATWFW